MSFVSGCYSAGTFALSFPAAALMLLRARGRARWFERFGAWNLNLPDCIWFHGASLGEINGLLPVIKLARAKSPNLPLLATATSVTGLERAAESVSATRLLPFDNEVWLRRALRGVKPRAFVFSETEIWPATVDFLARQAVPMFLVNARISDYSFESYKVLRPLIAPALKKLDKILVSNQISAERFIYLGAEPKNVLVAGNAKYDLQPALRSSAAIAEFDHELFAERAPTLVLGSIRPGEEDGWFQAVRGELAEGKKLRLVVAPRHKEKFSYFAEKLSAYGLDFERRSELVAARASCAKPVLLLDTVGELAKVYALADLAFVGATLVDIGGHNPLEPAMYGALPVVGPHIKNIVEIAAALREKHALVEVRDAQSIKAVVARLFDPAQTIKSEGQRAQEVWRDFSGAAQRIFDVISKFVA